jgi:hypothetical protein
MTNILCHPAMDVGRSRWLRFYQEQLGTQRDQAVLALNTALASMTALQGDHNWTSLAPMIESFRTAAEAFARIDPLAPPDAALVARLADALDRMARLTFDSRNIS